VSDSTQQILIDYVWMFSLDREFLVLAAKSKEEAEWLVSFDPLVKANYYRRFDLLQYSTKFSANYSS
jgi:hypothetical protein